ncbi:hypothetical protein PCANC_23746 [Puccinia coronata f. sp. avenae]|uniref:RING-type domain-containing protein n=1 Tax=Puccinia coronata f. sp. avenae TaxID=200324 RepID=A0A2N5UAX9_9BASI|nr:hypothetical protein PCASD_26378 [Puccinia coronata f. sp. avenae]PLW11962.1 hypothetical protein PCANC_24231 [Puccinia coronata f. sp. avenae]PLW25993.1 hypothetical protein PCASD_25697 [Puccinia coronata f. sp. avenae]PLW34895.1 hypothetical protein PCANC_23746 [Puccinia coronata f. sp. avenae]
MRLLVLLISVATLINAIPMERQPHRSIFGQCKNTFKSMKSRMKGSQSAPNSRSAPFMDQGGSSMGFHHSVEDTSQEDQCQICMSDLKEDQEIIPFSTCRDHRFHTHCIHKWTQKYLHPTCPTCRAVDPVVEKYIQRRREQLESDPHKARLDNFDVLVELHGVSLGRLEALHHTSEGSNPLEPLDSLPGDPLARVEQLVEHNEDRLRCLTSNLNRRPRYLELQGANPEDLSARLDSLEQLLHHHGVWIKRLESGF